MTVATQSSRAPADRVRPAQQEARRSLTLAAAFAVAAAASALLAGDDRRWVGLHLFLAGSAVLAISGSTQLFTVTWSAGPAPSRRIATVQRALVAVGAAGVVGARASDAPGPVLVASAISFVAGLVLLGAILATTVRRGVERRFDVAVAWYLVALAAAVVAACLGAVMGTGGGGPGLRPAHITLNLLGLVGLVVGGTLPTFAATMARTRMPRRATKVRHARLLGWQSLAVAGAALGFATSTAWLAAAGLGAYAGGVALSTALLPWPRRKDITWAGPRLLGLWAAIGWWVVAVAATAVQAGRGGAALADRWVVVLALPAYGQLLWASAAYLFPVVRAGGHTRLTAGFGATRSWPGLVAVNLAGVALVAGLHTFAALAVGVWFVDTAARAVAFARQSTGRGGVAPTS